MSRRRLLVGVLVVAALVTAGYRAYQSLLAPRPAEQPAATAGANSLAVSTGAEVVSAEGQVTPLRHAALTFLSAGRVEAILVTEGDRVTAGQPLVRLEAAELEATVAQAEAGVTQAEAGVAQAEAAVQAAEAAEVTSRTLVEAARGGVAAADAQLALLVAGPSPEEVAALESNVAAVEAVIAQAAANRDAATSGATATQIQAAQAQVAAAQAQARVAQDQYNQIASAGIGGTPEEQARFALNAAEASLAAAQAALADLTSGPTAAQQRAADAAVSVAIAQRDAAQAQLDLLLAGARTQQVAAAAADLSQAEAAVAQAEAAVVQAEVAVAQAEAAVTLAEAGVAQARAGRDAAQAALERMTLVAPFDGTVLSIEVEPAEAVSQGAPVVFLADTSGWLVETADLTELDVVAVAAGYPVEVRLDAIPDSVMGGTVTDIASVASLSRGEVTYTVLIVLEETAGLPLRWGMTALVDIDVRQ